MKGAGSLLTFCQNLLCQDKLLKIANSRGQLGFFYSTWDLSVRSYCAYEYLSSVTKSVFDKRTGAVIRRSKPNDEGWI